MIVTYSGSVIICTSGIPVRRLSSPERDNGGVYEISKLHTVESSRFRGGITGDRNVDLVELMEQPFGILPAFDTDAADVAERSQPDMKRIHPLSPFGSN